jgi:chloramphenicol 3-O phosphotransferase
MNKNIFWLMFAIATILFGYGIFSFFKHTTSYGTVIILNGPSASGKSSIQKEFQYLMMPNLWIKLGIDNLFDKPMPDINLENLQFWQTENQIRWVETTQGSDQNAIITLFVGPDGEKVVYGMNSAIAEYAKNGCNIIVDYIAYKKKWLDDLRDKLKNMRTYWVKVTIPLSVLEEREVARSTSPKGHARSHYDFVYWNVKYDLEVNSAKESAAEIAKRIKSFFKL